VIEVAAVRLERGRITDRWRTFCRPDRPVPSFITRLTGIEDSDVADAPAFDEIAGDLRRRLQGALFTAHNARFDAAFLRAEFARAGQPWSAERLCTVKLARKLMPGLGGWSLDAVTLATGVGILDRHRALGDAVATAEVLRRLLRRRGAARVIDAIVNKTMAEVHLPPGAADLPHGRGVWILRDEQGGVIRSARAADLFADFPSAYAALPKKLRKKSARVDFTPAPGELEAQAALPPEEPREVPFLTVTPAGEFVVGRPVAGRIYGPFRSVRDIQSRLRKAQGLPLDEAVAAITSDLPPLGLLRERPEPHGPGVLCAEGDRLHWVCRGRLRRSWPLEVGEDEIREEILRRLDEPFDPDAFPRVQPRGAIRSIEYFLKHDLKNI
jgi:DNA polymerase III epsilon subunit family exonuclease